MKTVLTCQFSSHRHGQDKTVLSCPCRCEVGISRNNIYVIFQLLLLMFRLPSMLRFRQQNVDGEAVFVTSDGRASNVNGNCVNGDSSFSVVSEFSPVHSV